MKKQTVIIAILMILSFLLITWLPCHADDIYGCAKKNKGTFRIVSDHSQCKKSEYPVTLYGTAPLNPLPNFQGELCWSIKDEIAKLRVLHIGGGHYIVSGKTTVNGTLHNIIHGNAVLEGSNIYMTLVKSEKDSEGEGMDTGIMYGAVDSATLNGTSEGIRHIRNYSDQPFVSGDISIDSDTQYSTSPITLIPCP